MQLTALRLIEIERGDSFFKSGINVTPRFRADANNSALEV